MPYSLQKVDGTAGDSGQMSLLVWEENGEVKYENNASPRVGCIIRVGSIFGRSYASQDYWQTSLIEEILDEWKDNDKECIRFKTKNSIYIWKKW